MVYEDEDYIRTLHIKEMMNLTTNINEDDESINYGRLPCGCQAGWNDMDTHDQRGHSTDSIFDCSCSEAPVGPSIQNRCGFGK